MRSMRVLMLALAIAWLPPDRADAQEAAVSQLFDQLAAQPARLRIFLQAMPKGGDLHHHLGGAPYAEDFITWAGEADMCVSREKLTFAASPCAAPDLEPARDLGRRDEALYGRLIDRLSVRGRNQGVGVNDSTGHEDFFSSFQYFGPVGAAMPGAMLAAARRSAAANGVSYLETMPYPREMADAAQLVPAKAWRDDDFEAAAAAIAPRLAPLVARARADTDAMEADARQRLDCGKAPTAGACGVSVRYQAFAFRSLPAPAVFGQIAFAFAMAGNDPRFVAVNFVAPEDGAVAIADFDLHMRMFRFFAARHPAVKLAIHAGELDLGLVAPDALTHHIRDTIEIAGASRIGHGVSLPYERDAPGLLADMARRKIAVEINLSSNDVILGVKGARHPLAAYRVAGVPVVISTDDEGVARSDMTNEYLRAATEQGLRYADLKAIARSSLEYAFLPGESLWQGREPGRLTTACAKSMPVAGSPCWTLLASSEKAVAQWRLEEEFVAFERAIVTQRF